MYFCARFPVKCFRCYGFRSILRFRRGTHFLVLGLVFFKPRLPFVIYNVRAQGIPLHAVRNQRYWTFRLWPGKVCGGQCLRTKTRSRSEFWNKKSLLPFKNWLWRQNTLETWIFFQAEFVVFRLLFTTTRGVNEKVIRTGSYFCLFVQLEYLFTFVQNNFGVHYNQVACSGYYICLRLLLRSVKKMQNGPRSEIRHVLEVNILILVKQRK